MVNLVIVGTAGMGREAAAWIEDAGRAADLLGFLDDAYPGGSVVADYPVLGGLRWLSLNREVAVVAAISSPTARQRLVKGLDAINVPLATIVHPTARIGPGVTLGEGVIVSPRVLLSRDVVVGRAVILNSGVIVGHDSAIGDLAFLDSGVRIGGGATIGLNVTAGVGASVNTGVTIGDRARVGPGAVVVHDVPFAGVVPAASARRVL